MPLSHFVAINLGASNGRVIVARFDAHPGILHFKEIAHFPNIMLRMGNHDVWDVDALERAILSALEGALTSHPSPLSIGIDSWAIDFVLLDQKGRRVGLAVSYRDARTKWVMARAQRALGKDFIFQQTGIQFQPFNTLYQLKALTEETPEIVHAARRGFR